MNADAKLMAIVEQLRSNKVERETLAREQDQAQQHIDEMRKRGEELQQQHKQLETRLLQVANGGVS